MSSAKLSVMPSESHVGISCSRVPLPAFILCPLPRKLWKWSSSCTMVHELLHFQSFLGSGHKMKAGSGTREQEMPTWLSEGITESFAELMVPSGEAPTYSYCHEVLSAVLLERVAGLDALK